MIPDGRPSNRFSKFLAYLLLFVTGLIFAGCQPNETTTRTRPPRQNPVERGKYLVQVGACSDCHTPLKMGANGPEPDMSRFLSGHPENMKVPPPPKPQDAIWIWSGAATNTAFAGPWGVTYAINLTPDQNTGIGIWTEDMFLHALKDGKHMGSSRPIMPPMPWQAYGKMTDDDLKAIYAYLRSLPAITNHVLDYQPAANANH